MSSTTKNHDKKAVSDNRLRDATKAVRRPGRIRALAIAAGIAAAPILAGAQPASAWGYWKTEAFAARAQFGERYYGGEWRGGYCRYGGRNFGDSLARAAIAGAAMGITNGIISAFANNNRNYYQQPYYPNYYYQQPYYPNYYYQQPYYPNYYYQQPTYQYQYPNTYVNADPPATPAAEQYSAPPAMPAQAIITPGFVYVNGKAIPVGTTAGALASNTEVQRLEAKQKVLENKVTAMQKELTVMKRAETQTSSKQP